MKIIVCVKQVPSTQNVKIDLASGMLIRDGTETETNPYDTVALDLAAAIKKETGASVTAITMGPPSAVKTLREALARGADEACLLSDPAFAGADVYATSYTLFQAVQFLGGCDLIICGRQSTDANTAQTAPQLAQRLEWPLLAWVSKTEIQSCGQIRITQNLDDTESILTCKLPCVIMTGSMGTAQSMPSLRAQLEAKRKNIQLITLKDLCDQDSAHYGAKGSRTAVVKTYASNPHAHGIEYDGTVEEIADRLTEWIAEYKNG